LEQGFSLKVDSLLSSHAKVKLGTIYLNDINVHLSFEDFECDNKFLQKECDTWVAIAKDNTNQYYTVTTFPNGNSSTLILVKKIASGNEQNEIKNLLAEREKHPPFFPNLRDSVKRLGNRIGGLRPYDQTTIVVKSDNVNANVLIAKATEDLNIINDL